MKLSAVLLTLSLLAPVLSVSVDASLVARQNGRQRGGGGQNQNGGNNNGAGNGNNNNGAGNGNNGAGNGAGQNGNNGGGDPQTSLTLDQRVIGANFANDGQDQPEPGQVPSLTSTNNFINFCVRPENVNRPITNGQQLRDGSCNPIPIGAIPSTNRMPSSKFTNPKNGDNIPADTPFTISMAIKNLVTGNFVNAQKSYFAAPQQLDGSGTIIGHSHVCLEKLTSLDQTTPTDPNVFAFFKGLNAPAQGGVLTADVTNGVPAGAYRLCSINAAANHQPVIVPIAQHGSLDDCIYFTVGGQGGNNQQGNQGANQGNNNGANNGNNGANQNNNGANQGNQGAQNGQGQQGNQGAQNGQGQQNGQQQGQQNGQQNGQQGGGRRGGGRRGGRNGQRSLRKRFAREMF